MRDKGDISEDDTETNSEDDTPRGSGRKGNVKYSRRVHQRKVLSRDSSSMQSRSSSLLAFASSVAFANITFRKKRNIEKENVAQKGSSKRNSSPCSRIEQLQFKVNVTCSMTNDKREITDLSCRELQYESYSANTSAASYSSTAKSPASSCATTVRQAAHLRNLLQQKINAKQNREKIHNLKKKWSNSQLVYNVLAAIDTVFDERLFGVNTAPISRKAAPSFEDSGDLVPEKTTKRCLSDPGSTPNASKRQRTSKWKTKSLKVKDWIFAKLKRRYVLAQVIAGTGAQCTVRYLSGLTADVNLLEIIPNDPDLLQGKKIKIVQKSSNRSVTGTVVRPLNDNNMLYLLSTDKGMVQVKVTDLYFTEALAYNAKKESPNYVTTSEFTDTGSDPGVSGLQQQFAAGSADSQAASSASLISGCEPEVGVDDFYSSKIKLKTIKGRISLSQGDTKVIGPPVPTVNIFQGMYFILTCNHKHFNANGGDSSEETDSENFVFSSIPFVSSHLQTQIRAGGGHVFDTVAEIPQHLYKKTYLVAARPCFTDKYLMCVSLRIKVICHEWIVNCCKEHKLLPLQELPIGWSLENKKFVNTFNKRLKHPLKNKVVAVAALKSDKFYQFWSTICCNMGAICIRFLPGIKAPHLIVCENGIEDVAIDDAISAGIPVVSTVWVVQTLIHGHARKFDAHLKYCHLYPELDVYSS